MKNILFSNGMLLVILSCILLTSCYKKFDPKSYQPTFTINGYTSSNDVGQGHLVAYWAFDGSTIDSVSGTTGSSVGTSFATGFKGQALQGAANGYVISDLPDAIKNIGSFTIDFWINTPQNTAGAIAPICITKEDDFWGSLDLFYENGSTASSANFKAHFLNGSNEVWFTTAYLANPWGAWQNVAFTYDASSSTFKIYQGGNVVTGGTLSSPGLGNIVFPSSAKHIIFGTEQFNCNPSIGTAGGAQDWESYLTGQLDEVRIYNTPLNASDLQALMILQGKGK